MRVCGWNAPVIMFSCGSLLSPAPTALPLLPPATDLTARQYLDAAPSPGLLLRGGGSRVGGGGGGSSLLPQMVLNF